MQNKFNTLGAMIDCSRNAVMTVEEMKKFILILSKMGYNELQLYMSDTYEIEGEEFFGYKRGRYSMEEMREISEFADKHGIEAVPCMQTLAHLGGIFRWKKYTHLRDSGDVLMVGEPEVYEFIEKMFKTLKKCFKSNKIHIGMDEAHSLGKGKYREKHGDCDRMEIFLEHLEKVCLLADKHGLKPQIWSDMFYRIYHGGQYYVKDGSFPKELKARMPKNVSLVYWNYNHINKERYTDMFKSHKQLSDNIAFAGGAWKWFSFVPHNKLGIEATTAALESCIENDIKEVLITLWGDNGGECSVYAALPTLCTAACINIGITDSQQIKKKFNEWTGENFDDFMLLDLPDYVENFNPDHVVNPCKYQLFNDCFAGLYDKGGVCDNDGKNYAEISKKLKTAADNSPNFKYIFDSAAALCDTLELKAEIGIRTRKAYQEKDFDTLRLIVADFCEMIDRTKEFYNLFRKQWYKENKSVGFEVQDIRLGGLIMRMKNCCSMLEEYLSGKTDRVWELEEEILQIVDDKKLIYSWREAVSVNGL